jgi:hypothetical protein
MAIVKYVYYLIVCHIMFLQMWVYGSYMYRSNSFPWCTTSIWFHSLAIALHHTILCLFMNMRVVVTCKIAYMVTTIAILQFKFHGNFGGKLVGSSHHFINFFPNILLKNCSIELNLMDGC